MTVPNHSSYTARYFNKLKSILDEIEKTQAKAIGESAGRILKTIVAGKTVYFFGCTHAGILAQEAAYRTGGLAVINPIFPPGLTCDVVPVTLTSQMERLEGYGTVLAAEQKFDRGDLLFIHSVSGRNPVTVELAAGARAAGVFVIAITNMRYSSASLSRHSGGKRLFENADLVIDNCGEFGDAAVTVEGVPQKTSPTSTVSGTAIVNAVAAEAAALFARNGMVPPVFASANIEGGDAHNQEVFSRYRGQIKYM